MNTFNWQDGTIIERPYVEIDGTKYYVQDGSYSGGTPVSSTNLNQMQNILNQNITDAIESGTGYIKYNDGTMICYGSKSGTGIIENYYDYKKIDNDITFAQTFISIPKIAISSSGYEFLSASISNQTITGFNFRVIKIANATANDYNIDYIAIGNWK